jgi:hypothetical protein
MSRPLYETQQDRDNEQAMARIISARYGCTMHKMPMKYTLDYAAQKDGRVIGFVEMRRRRIPMHKYSTYMIALHKVIKAKELSSVTGLPCLLAIQWTDRLGIVDISKCEFEIEINGSMRRNDPQDIEPMALINIAEFQEIDQ